MSLDEQGDVFSAGFLSFRENWRGLCQLLRDASLIGCSGPA